MAKQLEKRKEINMAGASEAGEVVKQRLVEKDNKR